MDDKDRLILRCLEEDTRLTYAQLGERVGLAALENARVGRARVLEHRDDRAPALAVRRCP